MSILFDFLTEQIFSFISGQVLDHAYTSARLGVRLKYTSNLLNEQMNAMDDSVDLSEFLLHKGNVEQFIQQDSRFHELMYQASGSKVLEDLLTDYHQYIKPVREASIAAKNRSGHTNIEHRNIMLAIKERNGELAEKLANQHILNSMKNIGDCKIGIDKI